MHLKKFNEVFNKVDVPGRLRLAYGDALVTSVTVNTAERKMYIVMNTDMPGGDSLAAELEDALISTFPMVDSVELTCSVKLTEPPTAKKFDLRTVWEKIQNSVGEVSPVCRELLHGACLDLGDSAAVVRLGNKCSFLLLRNRINTLIEGILKDDCGLDARVSFLETDAANLPPPEIITPRQEVPKPTEKPAAPAKSQSKTEWKSSGFKGGGKRKGVEIKKDIKGVVTDLDEVLTEGDEIIAEGIIIKTERRETRNGRILCQMDITDGSDSITVKFFLKNKEDYTAEFMPVVEKGKGIRVFGTIRYDDFSREQCLMASEIMSVDLLPDSRTDKVPADEKRVELHLHTQMSQMDATNSVTDYIKRAAEWGMPAIAVTDHGVVQAFPEAMSAAKKHGIKVIYGMEAYIVDDMGAIVQNGGDHTLDSSFVAFDIETTGLHKENCGIIEIGAVKIENGEITGRFSTFVNPRQPLPEKIVKLTGITDGDLAGAPFIEDALPAFLEFAEDFVLCAHNAVFDIGFINIAAKRLGLAFNFANLCTLELSRALFPRLPGHKLNKVAEHLSIPLKNHHRAADDALATAGIFLKCREMLTERGINLLKDVNLLGSDIDVKKLPYYHAVILAKNQIGLRNLYELVSLSHIEYYSKRPRVPKSVLAAKREGLILGTACEAGEFFRAVLDDRPEEYLKELADFYDYLEIQCYENNLYLVREGRVPSADALKELNKKIVAYGETFNRPVVATCDVHFMNPRDSIYREIIMTGEGFKDADQQAPLYLRTTQEMLAAFDYLPPEKAREVVITNTRMIADMVETVKPVAEGSFPPNIEGSDETLRGITGIRLAEVYGETPPEIVQARIDRELGSIFKHGFSVMYVAAQKLVHNSMENGYLVGSRGSIGSSLSATMSGITEVNPLPAHYYCPSCKYNEFDSAEIAEQKKRLPGLSGYDMPDKSCPLCGGVLKKDGHDIPFETFLGFDCDKEPDIDLNFSGDYQAKAHAFAEELFGKGYVFKAGTIGTLADKTAFGYVQKYLEQKNIIKRTAEKNRLVSGLAGVKKTTGQHPGGLIVVPEGSDINQFCPVQRPANDQSADVITTHFDYHSALEGRLMKLDILGHDVPTIIKMLHDFTGADPLEIDLGNALTLSLFNSPAALGVTEESINCRTGTLGIPEFGTSFVRQMLQDTKPSTFTELVKISGLSHGTNVWFNNAQTLIKEGTASFSEVITTRDDIMLYLISMGVEKKTSFTIMEKVRKGRGVTDPEAAVMLEAGVPEWYVQSCRRIEYLFPKGHAVAYTMMSIRIGYYKIHYPDAFYAAVFTVKSGDFDYELMCKGRLPAKNELSRILALGKEVTAKDKTTLTILELVLEMYARGVNFLPIDLYKSQAKTFLPTPAGILPPLCTLQGLGDSAAQGIVDARCDGEFISIQDLKNRAKISKSVIELIIGNGILKGIPETNQLTLFM